MRRVLVLVHTRVLTLTGAVRMRARPPARQLCVNGIFRSRQVFITCFIQYCFK